MPVVDEVRDGLVAQIENQGPALPQKDALSLKTGADAISQITESINTLKASIKGDPLADPQYVTLLKLLKACASRSQDLKNNATNVVSTEVLRSVINEEQKRQLFYQIKAYKCLSRNLPIPPDVVREMGYLSMKQPARTNNTMPFICPPTLFRGNSSGSNELVASAIRDAIVVAHDREKRIHSKIQVRMEQLKVLPTNIVPGLKKQSQIELKQLRFLDYQKKIRSEIAGEVKRAHELESAADMDAYRKLALNQAEDEEIDIEHGDGEQSKFAAQRKFLIALHYHTKEFKEFHLQRDKQVKKLVKSIQLYHKDKEKREALLAEKKRRERLKLLRDNDVEGYSRLVAEAKDERLNQLMKQTGDFLAQMGILVAKEKDQVDGDNTEEAKAGENGQQTANSKTYYTAAHAIQEDVKEQPEMLVGGQLKEYQLAGVQWLVSLYNNKLNGILADEMGLGKTIQTIGMISYLMEKKGCMGPFMIAVPLSTVSNWSNEFAKWAPKINVVCYKGKPLERKQIYMHTISKLKFNVALISFEFVMKDKNDLSKLKWEYVILDEGHRIKNKNSKLSTILRQYTSKHRLLLTGTPLQNDLSELWALLNFLLPTIFNSVDNFENWFNSPFAYDKNTKKTPSALQVNEEESLIIINRLHQVLRPFLLRRLKSDVESQLPEKRECVLKCSLSAMQHVMYEQIRKNRGLMAADPNAANYKKSTRGFNNVIMQLQKICNHPYLFRDEWDVDVNMIRASGKFELMDRMLLKLKATKHRVLIFTQMTHVISIMEEYFHWREFEYLRLDGQTKQEERAEMVKQWNSPDSPYFIFVLSTHAGGLGLNLQTADTVIIFDTDWNPHMDLQAQDRAHRIGQTQEVRVFRLVVQNSLEQQILDRASFKLNIDAKIIQAGMFNNNASDEMRREMLEGLLRDTYDQRPNDDDDLVTTNEQLNQALARNDAEIELFQKMDEDEENEWKAKQKKGIARPSRLTSLEEVPAWMLIDPAETRAKEEDDLDRGRGKRQRSDVNYDDGLTENQFVRIMEKGISVEDYRQARAKRRSKREGGAEVSDSDSDISSDSQDESSQASSSKKESGPKTPSSAKKKKTVRHKMEEFSEEEAEILDEMCALTGEEPDPTAKRRRQVKRKKDDDGSDHDGENESDGPKKKRKTDLKLKINLKGAKDKEKDKEKKEKKEGEGSGKKRGRKPKGNSASAEIFRAIWQVVRSATDDSGRVLSAIFMELPNAEEYADYYDVIKNPICMAQIKRKKYQNLAEFRKDFVTMFDNAKEYNEATSQVYSDATTLFRIFEEECEKRAKDIEAAEREPPAAPTEADDAADGDEDTKKKRGRPKKDKGIKKEKEKEKEKETEKEKEQGKEKEKEKEQEKENETEKEKASENEKEGPSSPAIKKENTPIPPPPNKEDENVEIEEVGTSEKPPAQGN
eukprot:Phypoly_transcript_00555.p1 GENE.Phypoly_transcript_00555~~Phypoly_transcript_00555.p1  ORF type:complete len:1422 (+),score=377.64 Phypoly_transcript_00555:70-4335(+)